MSMVTAKLDLKFWKQHACVACGCKFRYFIQRAARAQAYTQAAALAAAEKQAEKKIKRDVDCHACPECGVMQPEMVAQIQRQRFLFAVGLFTVGVFAPMICYGAGAMTIGQSALWATIAAVLYLILVTWSAAFNPNARPAANRKKVIGALKSHKLQVVQSSGSATEVDYNGTSTGLLHVMAIVLCMAAAATSTLPLVAQKHYQWHVNEGIWPSAVGPGDEVRVKFDEEITSLQSKWRGEASAIVLNLDEVGLDVSDQLLVATTNDSEWGEVISGKWVSNNTNNMYATVRLPDDALPQKTIRLAFTVNATYPLEVMGGFVEKTSTFHHTAEFQLSAANAGTMYRKAWQLGMLGCVLAAALAGGLFYVQTELLRRRGNPAEVLAAADDGSVVEIDPREGDAFAAGDDAESYDAENDDAGADFAPTPASIGVGGRQAKRKDNRLARTAAQLLAVFVFLFGLLVFASFGWMYLQGQRSSDWPTVEGHIVESSIDETVRERSDGPVFKYTPIVRYEFQVDGTKYTSDRISYGLVTRRTKDKAKVDAIVAKYPRDGRVPVFYNPENPVHCALEAGVAGENILMNFLIAGGVFMLLGAGLFVLGLWRRSSSAPIRVSPPAPAGGMQLNAG